MARWFTAAEAAEKPVGDIAAAPRAADNVTPRALKRFCKIARALAKRLASVPSFQPSAWAFQPKTRDEAA